MNEHEINARRFSSNLLELINEAISTLNNRELAGLNVVYVDVARGKSDADVYIDGSSISKDQKDHLLSALEKSSGYLNKYCLSATGKMRMPKFHFKIDSTIQDSSKIDELFKKIEDERRNRKKD